MRPSTRIARTLAAFGRFRIPLALALLTSGCAVAGPGTSARSGPALPEPVVRQGEISPAREAEAARMFREALTAFQEGRAADARRMAAEIVSSYPTAPVSGRALLLEARAALASSAFAEADSAAGRYAGLLTAGDPRAAAAEVVQAQARDSLGDARGALLSLLRVQSTGPASVVAQAVTMGRSVVTHLDEEALANVMPTMPVEVPVAPVVSARYAALLQARGQTDQAKLYAQAALQAGATGPDSAAASMVLQGETPPGVVLPVMRIGLVLPETGPPTVQQVGSLVAEGVEVAVASAEQRGIRLQVERRDDQGDPAEADTAVQSLESDGVIAAIGFLEAPVLQGAAEGRQGAFPLVSPTARLGATASPGVYSLESADLEGAAAIARYAAAADIRRVAIIHSRAPQSVSEANAFAAEADSLGLPIVGMFAYDVGSTSFQDQILGAADSLRSSEIAALDLGPDDTLHAEQLTPVALFVPVPPEDVQYLAPQITFYGLDTLAIQVLGTGGWTNPQVLRSVDPRHTNGVVATAPVAAGEDSPAYTQFRAAYEAQFRRSLVSPIPALGYDAALVVLNAIQQGAQTPAQAEQAMSRIQGLVGATGILSVKDGRLVRHTQVVRLDHGTFVPIR